VTTTSSNMPPALSHKAPASSIETARETAQRARPALAALVGAAALALSIPHPASASLGTPRGAPASPRAQAPHQPAAPPRAIAAARIFAQTLAQNDDGGGDATADKGASPEQIEKYVAVYRAMQRNHNLTVEQAAAAQGLTVGAFRELERRIESDDAARDAARNALAAPAQSATPAVTPEAQR
jgi:hypothetical protein